MTTKLYLDTRASKNDSPAQIKISISEKGQTAYIPTGVSVLREQWNTRTQKIIQHPERAKLNLAVSQKKYRIDSILFGLKERGELYGLSAREIKDVICDKMNPETRKDFFLPRLEAYAETKTCPTTKYTYTHTAEKIRAFQRDADKLLFTDITPKWLDSFNRWMGTAAPSQNARNIILRNIRTVFNDAIDDGVTEYYPFRKYKIRAEMTRSRALTVGQVKALFSHGGIYVDMFKLSFYLGGISFCDLCALTPANIIGDRIEYHRQKTKQFVSVALQPEAKEIIDRYRGTEHLILISDRGDYHTFLNNMGKRLKKVKGADGLAIAPSVSQYWARYTIATLAAECGASMDAIGSLLGHSKGGVVTSLYVRANMNRIVDRTLRMVLDKIKEG